MFVPAIGEQSGKERPEAFCYQPGVGDVLAAIVLPLMVQVFVHQQNFREAGMMWKVQILVCIVQNHKICNVFVRKTHAVGLGKYWPSPVDRYMRLV
jgi:hypothetical protein